MELNSNRGNWENADSPKVEILTPQKLWDSARAYFKWCDLNPIKTPVLITAGKSAGQTMMEQHIRPYSLKGLCLEAGVTEEWFKDCMIRDGEWSMIAKTIVGCIWTQVYEMAMIGKFSPIFAAKILNVGNEDDTPKKILIEYVNDLPQLSTSENEILEKLKIERGEIEIINSEISKGKK